jgi:hypothetical protein
MMERLGAWGGPFCAALFGAGLLIAGFVPPPAPTLTAAEITQIYSSRGPAIAAGMVLALFGLIGYLALVGAISSQMRAMRLANRYACYLQLGAGSIGMLTVMLPAMIFAVATFRPDRPAAITQMLNDLGWLIIIPAFPTFIAQFGAIAAAIFADKATPAIYPRWLAYFNIWIAILFVPGGFAYFVRTGPFAWDGLLAFWGAAAAFFLWLVVMCSQVLASARRSLN